MVNTATARDVTISGRLAWLLSCDEVKEVLIAGLFDLQGDLAHLLTGFQALLSSTGLG
jgi:hypothetical protein